MSKPPRNRTATLVFLDRPRCPQCGSLLLKITRSVDQGDGSRKQYVRCRSDGCMHAFQIIWE